jgi:hypothetical protein
MLNPYHVFYVQDHLIVNDVLYIVVTRQVFEVEVGAGNDQGQSLDRLHLTEAIEFKAPDSVAELLDLYHSGDSSWFEGLNLGFLCPLSNGLGKDGKGHTILTYFLNDKQAQTIAPNPSNKVSVKVNKGRFWLVIVTF